MKNKIIINNITQLIVHYVGNKNEGDGVSFSKKLSTNSVENAITSLVKNSFSFDEWFSFYFIPNVELNPIYHFMCSIFRDSSTFINQSINCAKHLYNQSTHPMIKEGEFYTVYFKDCILDGETVDAVGLFKSENKDIFLKVLHKDGNFNLESEKGINIKKLDKGCLIFNKEKENGYVVAIVDNTNKGVEAQYWIDDFLHVRSRKDEYSNTQNIMALAKNFVTKELTKESEVSTTEQINLLNKSLDFFKGKENFDLNDFTNEVISQPDVIKKFQQFKKDYEEANDVTIDNHFAISDAARKKQQRSYKRVIHLDKKIQIVIDGNCDHVEQGKDSKGKYYKVYYNEED